VPVPTLTDYELEISSDDEKYGGQGLVAHMTYHAKEFDGKYYVELYLPARTAVVLKEKKHKKTAGKAKKV
ncbi:MAG: alpha amylase C-terminal domain-containing protein, partial [Oscillibacter sp.]|nr:alpha amylase C-terminal domain-containing protein [Oscillibacter sp.]